MYVVIQISTNKAFILKESTQLAELIGVSVKTIYRNSNKEFWTKGDFNVYIATKCILKSNRGAKNGNHLKNR